MKPCFPPTSQKNPTKSKSHADFTRHIHASYNDKHSEKCDPELFLLSCRHSNSGLTWIQWYNHYTPGLRGKGMVPYALPKSLMSGVIIQYPGGWFQGSPTPKPIDAQNEVLFDITYPHLHILYVTVSLCINVTCKYDVYSCLGNGFARDRQNHHRPNYTAQTE